MLVKRGGGYGKCEIIKPNSSFKDLFSEKMRIILANQSLYYLPHNSFQQTINEFYELLEKGGILFATMMSERNYHFAFSSEQNNDTYMRKVQIKARLCEESFIHFIKEAKELTSLFKPFTTLYLGEYDLFSLYDFEGSAHHYIYIGIKK
ncbi:methyltransferase [Campylobacter sp. MIT 21-1684]|uniref:methyltransferase n=1 Tax=Campylobacter sp. MIT 21-1684 TaxID=2994322 RepID=UPI00224A77C4|nr:methyltransferase [Campylobacter sp. MIT 21-1684]MCX2683723.1 methyltransferase [Campylobacter sp. MIT 21-1684]